jgi:DNA polymerase
MALNLDTRQRAMLRAMGITIWLPQPASALAEPERAPTPAPVGPPQADATALPVPATPLAPPRTQQAAPLASPVAAPVPRPSPQEDEAPARMPRPASEPAVETGETVSAPMPARPARRYVQQPAAGAPGLGWRLGPARPVYPAALDASLTEGGWLILLEPPANTLPLPPEQRPGPDCARTALEGDAARLLDNMLRALQLQRHPRVYSAALHRVLPGAEGQAPSPDQAPALQPALEALLRDLRPACVLVLGLASARAVLERQDALGRLRAEPHRIAGIPAVVSYDPNYLLRAPQAKAGAWADLCHAQAFVTGRA